MKSVQTMTTYLEMWEPIVRRVVAPQGVDVQLLKQPSAARYWQLYRDVGREYHWVNRALLNAEELLPLIHAEDTSIFLLRKGGQDAGFCELDGSQPDEVEISYFGLLPQFVGQGLGTFFLNWTIHQAWETQLTPKRVWLHTCDLDHPAALSTYQKAGFSVYKTQVEQQTIPTTDEENEAFEKGD